MKAAATPIEREAEVEGAGAEEGAFVVVRGGYVVTAKFTPFASDADQTDCS